MATIFIIPSSSSLFQLYHNHSYASSSYHLYHYYHSINLYHRLHIASSLLSSCDYYCHDNPHNIILIIILVETWMIITSYKHCPHTIWFRRWSHAHHHTMNSPLPSYMIRVWWRSHHNMTLMTILSLLPSYLIWRPRAPSMVTAKIPRNWSKLRTWSFRKIGRKAKLATIAVTVTTEVMPLSVKRYNYHHSIRL